MTSVRRLGSVIIPAHDEAATVGRCLDALFAGLGEAEVDVVVACNGCADDTAGIARAAGHRIRVLEHAVSSKAAALRAGEAATRDGPRLYLDADVVLPGASARRVLHRLAGGAVAARPPVAYETARSSAPVRGYYRARAAIPELQRSLWGAGAFGLSSEGRGRFGAFPDVVGDDLWVDRHFGPGEVEIVDCAPVVVTVPRRSRDLVGVLRRTYRGKAEPGPAGPAADTARSTVRGLVRLAAGSPTAALDVAAYAAFAAGARVALAVEGGAAGAPGRWERDESSRAV